VLVEALEDAAKSLRELDDLLAPPPKRPGAKKVKESVKKAAERRTRRAGDSPALRPTREVDRLRRGGS
jgi:hypothetical protein